ncbi:putative deacetylase LmbE-like domain-containing protein [Kockovaella imperatae]|uniref:N-acetylglucosaminylphosphatidylinositol deacetylase n=1 Tax=Kockovaella imperatae TaxID=4999 RepID=A0A1Y1UIL5_9TREE|nr:putative deacetylase LmbE-like domain-containing protein [Kockovaella imperatae]ORX37397.1 putative deacetylase LmbE-like domain-containing protein [Kockovaella imperatae]
MITFRIKIGYPMLRMRAWRNSSISTLSSTHVMTILYHRLWLPIILAALVVRLWNAPQVLDLESLLQAGNGKEDHQERSVLVLTAHPDDEAMFFAPSILYLIESGWDVYGLCLSTGNATGLGEIRKRELVESYRILGVSADKVYHLDEPSLQDGMNIIWEPEAHILPYLQAHLEKQPVKHILTFDAYGVTQHPNHMNLPRAAQAIGPAVKVITLKSPSVLSKFTGVLWILYHKLFSRSDPDVAIVISSPRQWWAGIRGMLEHRSQLVWFRWLYLAFSRLMWVNELVLL